MSRGTAKIADNPFYVLELSPESTSVVIERQGNKLLAMLELGLVEAESYDTPFGVRQRTPDAVRGAMAELRDPDRRLVHELWAAMDPTRPIEHVGESADEGPGRWDDAMQIFGWGPRR